MKHIIATVVLIGVVCTDRFFAASTELNHGQPVIASVLSTNGLMMGIIMRPPYLTTNTTEQVITLTFSLSNTVGIVYVPKTDYFARFSLWDSEKHPVPKTALGLKYDMKSGQLVWWDDQFMGPKIHGEHTPYSVFPNQWSRGVDLPAVDELFQVKKPGCYQLRIDAQVFFRHNFNGQNSKEIAKFEPLVLTLMQPVKFSDSEKTTNVLQKAK